jgi:hypothetical protein
VEGQNKRIDERVMQQYGAGQGGEMMHHRGRAEQKDWRASDATVRSWAGRRDDALPWKGETKGLASE